MSVKLYLLRHGLTQDNEENRYPGGQDLPLSPRGRARLGPAPWEPDRLYVSPLRRARETAAILFPRAAQMVVEDLREMDFGVFGGHTYEELIQNSDYVAWLDGTCQGPCPGGESKGEFCRRTCAAVERILDAVQGEETAVAIVAHGGTQMAVLERFARPRQDYYAWHAPCGGGYWVEWEQSAWKTTRELRVVNMVQLGREDDKPC